MRDKIIDNIIKIQSEENDFTDSIWDDFYVAGIQIREFLSKGLIYGLPNELLLLFYTELLNWRVRKNKELLKRLLSDFSAWKNIENIDIEYQFDSEVIIEKYFECEYFKDEFTEKEQEFLKNIS